MKDEIFYEEISAIVAKVSTRTLKMKTNNVKLLNKIGFELSYILNKVNDIVRLYQADKNEFINDVELIQRDYIDMSRKIDEKFTQSNESQSNKNFENSNLNTIGQTNLQRILNTSNSSNSEIDSDNESITTKNSLLSSIDKRRKQRSKNISVEKQSIEKSELNNTLLSDQTINSLMIPDTCPIFGNQKPVEIENPYRLIIRETVDSNEILQNNEINDNENIENNSSIIQNESLEIPKLKSKKKKKVDRRSESNIIQSTPMSVKKKLQEHGLLDLTNSPNKKSSQNESQLQQNRSLKNYQQDFSPSIINKPLDQKNTTPMKFLMLERTPNKSPSLTFKTVINQQKAVNISTFDLHKERNNEKQKNNKKLSAPGTDKTFESQFNLYHEIPSPKKGISNTKPAKKRFKQLTMSQAFAAQKITPTKNNNDYETVNTTASNDLDETCIQSEFNLNEATFVKVDKNVMDKIKEEPIEQQRSIIHNISILKTIKPEPMEENHVSSKKNMNRKRNFSPAYNEEDSTEEIDFDSNDEAKFFADFDKVPKRKENEPGFKCVQVVRKQDERKKLGTMSCKECETYWKSLPEDKRPERMDEMCRHRAKYQPPATPEHYWSISFPNTQDCIDRGYGGVLIQNDKEDSSKRPRRKRPLKLKEKKNTIEDENEEGKSDYDFGDID